jgi:hypothetical protein
MDEMERKAPRMQCTRKVYMFLTGKLENYELLHRPGRRMKTYIEMVLKLGKVKVGIGYMWLLLTR